MKLTYHQSKSNRSLKAISAIVLFGFLCLSSCPSCPNPRPIEEIEKEKDLQRAREALEKDQGALRKMQGALRRIQGALAVEAQEKEREELGKALEELGKLQEMLSRAPGAPETLKKARERKQILQGTVEAWGRASNVWAGVIDRSLREALLEVQGVQEDQEVVERALRRTQVAQGMLREILEAQREMLGEAKNETLEALGRMVEAVERALRVLQQKELGAREALGEAREALGERYRKP